MNSSLPPLKSYHKSVVGIRHMMNNRIRDQKTGVAKILEQEKQGKRVWNNIRRKQIEFNGEKIGSSDSDNSDYEPISVPKRSKPPSLKPKSSFEFRSEPLSI